MKIGFAFAVSHDNRFEARHFGKNIRMVNQHFVPVKISSESPEEVISILNANMHWIQDELENSSDGYKLFTINSGILKTPLGRN